MTTATDLSVLRVGTPEDLAPYGGALGIERIEAPRGRRGLVLNALKLNRGYDPSLLTKLHLRQEVDEIGVLSVAMDFSGAAPVVWPPDRITATDAIIDMSPGEIFEWTLGSGAPVFPERDVVSGIAIAIHVFDSDHNIDAMGQKIEDAAAAVKTDGSLADLLKQLASDPGGVAADVLLGAVAEVGKIVGAILKDNQDDNVAFFTGYYEVDKSWDGKLHQDARGASIDLGALPTP